MGIEYLSPCLAIRWLVVTLRHVSAAADDGIGQVEEWGWLLVASASFWIE
jgi:hypothetical protein